MIDMLSVSNEPLSTICNSMNNTQANPTQAQTTETNATLPKRIVGKFVGKYAQPAGYLFTSACYYFDIPVVHAHVLSEIFMTDAGRAQCEVDGVKVSKAKKADNMVKFSETGETRMGETYALAIYRACQSLDKLRKAESAVDAGSFRWQLALADKHLEYVNEKAAEWVKTRFQFVDDKERPVSADKRKSDGETVE